MTEAGSVVALEDASASSRGSVGSVDRRPSGRARRGRRNRHRGPTFLGLVGKPREPGPFYTGDIGRFDEQGPSVDRTAEVQSHCYNEPAAT